MAHIYVSSVIEAPIDEVWAIARDYTGHWHSSVIYNSSIEGGLPPDQIGCVRAFELSDGGKLREVLVGMSDEQHEFSYRILESPLPVEDYFAAVRFAPVTTTGQTFGEWTADFRVPPDQEEATVATVTGVFEGGFADIADATQVLKRKGVTSMHLSMHNWMRSEPIEVTVARLARFGYGSIEIKGEPDQYDTADVRKLLADNGLTCWGAVTLTLAERNLCAKDEQQRAASVQYMKDCVTMVKELDGQEITIVPSTVGKVVPDGTPEQEWEWCVAGLQEIREHANAAGVRMAIEPLNRFETHFINRGEQALTLADAVGPDVGVCLDCFHMNIEEVDLLDTIRAIGPRLTDFHVADNNRMACGMGALDWPAIVGTLKEVGYDGALTVEFVAPIDRTPANRYPDALETNPVDISPEELQFIIDHGSSLLSEGFYSMLVEQCATTLLPLI